VVWLGKRFPVIGGGVCVTLISSRFTIYDLTSMLTS
jgi:hypothetical protein